MKVVCIVLLVILLLLVLILLLPAGGRLEYSEDGLIFSLRAGPIYYRIYPKKEKKTPPEELKPVTYPVNRTGDAAKPPPSPAGSQKSDAEPTGSGNAKPGPKQSDEPEPPPASNQPAGADRSPQAQPEQSDKKQPPKQAKKSRFRRKKSTKQPKSEQSEGKTGGKLELAMELAPELLDLAGALVRWMRVDELTLDYTIAGRWDAAGAAIQYGTVYATGGVLYPLLEQSMTIKRFHVGAEIDFQEEIPRVYVLLNLSWRVWALLVLLYRAFKLYMRLKKDE